MAKVEVQIRSCFCCGLSIATIFVALYSLLLFSVLTGLAAWGLSDTSSYGDASHYNSCELEAQGKIAHENRKLMFTGGKTTVVVEDSTSYHCSLGLYTEELKYSEGPRYTWLLVDIFLWVSLILASILLLIGIATYNHWLLVPWILLMTLEIIRGLLSTIMIFVYSHGNLARIATGIFFLGLQFFHISLLMVIIAKFQRIYNRRNGLDRPAGPYDQRAAYPPTAASNYGYSPDHRRDYYPDQASHRGGPDPYYTPQPQPGYEHAPQGYRY